MSESTQRASVWSITINNPVEAEYTCQLPAGWKLVGQLEQGKEGTVHYQGMLCTPQVRFSQVKKIFSRAHIEVAKNKSALNKYVLKTDTRIASVADNVSSIPTLFDFQHTIAAEFDIIDFDRFVQSKQPRDSEGKLTDKVVIADDVVCDYVDTLVAKHIENGVNGVEYIAINPMWRGAWKKFWRSMVRRELAVQINLSGPSIECPPSAESSPLAQNSSAENASLDL